MRELVFVGGGVAIARAERRRGGQHGRLVIDHGRGRAASFNGVGSGDLAAAYIVIIISNRWERASWPNTVGKDVFPPLD